LDAKPQLIKRDLNEWVAFDRPGRYTLRVISGRVGRVDGKPNRLTSNTLEFDIETADAAWQQQKVARAATVLDDPLARKVSARRRKKRCAIWIVRSRCANWRVS